jgi:predicted nucleotidyltransferase
MVARSAIPRDQGRPTIDREHVIEQLRAHDAELRRRGVPHAALFGSLARGEAGPESDIDIMLDIVPERPMGMFEYIGIIHFLEGLCPIQVDVTERQGLKSFARPGAERDAIYAF